ncbi:hypothetical protein [Lacrimispora amygdalina]|uniref:hypothetical protein n=1 Tax=Lacrimispora amygdalina TaxID=253257 RepID=UPI000BE27BC5|nr:hypothetical protein [Lacrimispora amygdalina]
MSLKLNIAKINEKRRIVLGEVISVKPATGGNVVNIELKGVVWNPGEKKEEEEVLSIAFWNNETVKMADRIVAAKVKEGSIITVDVYDNEGKLIGNNFKYQGHWIIPATDETKERNIFMGVVRLTEDPDGRFVRASMPIKTKNDEEPTWVSITFWNNEGTNVADRAKKVLGERDGKKAKAVIICGENKPYNGNPSYNGYDFVLLP